MEDRAVRPCHGSTWSHPFTDRLRMKRCVTFRTEHSTERSPQHWEWTGTRLPQRSSTGTSRVICPHRMGGHDAGRSTEKSLPRNDGYPQRQWLTSCCAVSVVRRFHTGLGADRNPHAAVRRLRHVGFLPVRARRTGVPVRGVPLLQPGTPPQSC